MKGTKSLLILAVIAFMLIGRNAVVAQIQCDIESTCTVTVDTSRRAFVERNTAFENFYYGQILADAEDWTYIVIGVAPCPYYTDSRKAEKDWCLYLKAEEFCGAVVAMDDPTICYRGLCPLNKLPPSKQKKIKWRIEVNKYLEAHRNSNY